MTVEAHPFDHAVINVRDQLDAAVTIFSRLGFSVTPRGFHTLGSINHLMVLGSTYLELIGFPSEDPSVRPELRNAAPGLNGLVFRSVNADHTYSQALARGAPVDPPRQFSRPVDLGVRAEPAQARPGLASAPVDQSGWPDAVFRTVRTPSDFGPGGRLYYCEHQTPELVWRDAWRAHPNGARELTRVRVESDDVSKTAKQFALMLGEDRVSQGGGPRAPALVQAPPLTIQIDAGPRQFMRALRLSVASLAQTKRWLTEVAIDFSVERDAGAEIVRVAAAQAGGVEFEFCEARS